MLAQDLVRVIVVLTRGTKRTPRCKESGGRRGAAKRGGRMQLKKKTSKSYQNRGKNPLPNSSTPCDHAARHLAFGQTAFGDSRKQRDAQKTWRRTNKQP